MHQPSGDVTVTEDEFPRLGSVIANFQKLRPCFKKDGSVTPANASGLQSHLTACATD